ncbi:MAG: putative LPS assembly protein LptD [Salinibacter sp.]
MVARRVLVGLGCAMLVWMGLHVARGQERPADTTRSDSVQVDTTRRVPTDSLTEAAGEDEDPPPSDPEAGPPDGAGARQGQGSAEAVEFSAQDSLVVVTDSGAGDRGSLHGEASMSHQGATLRARIIEMDFESGTLDATGPPSDTARNGRPVFEQRGGGEGGGAESAGAQQGLGGGDASFTGTTLSYNINTQRGRVVSAQTQRQDGFIQGGAVKVFEDSTLFVQGGLYTTCDCPRDLTPSYSLRSTEMKVQDQWVYTGPIQLFLFNVPTPLWLPFGLLPNTEGRRSGPLPPNYGEDRRGLFLKDWGWYFALNDYTDLTIRAGVWSQGSFEVRPRFRYNLRYNYSGDVSLTYRRERIGEEEDPSFQNRHEGQLNWTHDQTLSPTASLNGRVNLVTSSDFAQRNSDNYDDAVRQDISSSINYRKRWPQGGRQLNISANQKQKFQSGEVRLTAPDLSFSQNRFKPFDREQAVGQDEWYEKITTSYNFDLTNNFNYDPRDPQGLRENQTPGDSTLADSIDQASIDWYEALFDREKYRLATGDDELFDFEASHRVPLSASFRVDRYNLSISPNVDYTSDWYINTVRVVDTSDADQRRATDERVTPGFYARHDFSTSLSASTEAYGTFPIALGSFEGLRHRLSPSLSANYQPDFNRPFWGRTRPLRTPDGTPVVKPQTGEVLRYDILTGSLVQSSTEQRNLSFSLRNVFETKRVRVDSTGERDTEKVTLLNLDVQGLSYNFAADSFRVSDNIRLNGRTSIERFDVTANASFSPYALRPARSGNDGTAYQRVDRYMVAESPWTPARLTSFRMGVSGRFRSGDDAGRGMSQGRGAGGAGREGAPARPSDSPTPARDQAESSAPDGIAELDLPWSLSFDFNYRLNKPQKEITSRTATLGTQFSLGLTSKWQIQGRTGYDFVDDELATTRLSTSRVVGACDCWVMSFSWVPFGRYQSYSFNLQVRSGQLAQLLQLQLPNAGGEGRLGGFGDQLRGTVQNAAGGGQGRGGGRFP